MSPTPSKKLWLYAIVLFVFLGGGGAFVLFGPPQLYAKTGTPEYCGSCHVMEAEYEAWRHAGAHRRIKCIDCHLPNDNKIRHLTWKNIEGMTDMFKFYTGQVREDLRISNRGADTVLENCKRCHEETMARVNEDRRCWDCHRRLSHKLSGVRETL
jgi:cytochrome c nitrite reductase small subunit